MGKKIKKGKVGPSLDYISRARAIKKLQITLKDFRRLCILKGIYPREPPQSLKKTNKTYYHIKDINYLSHETILEKFRQQKIHIKKIKRAIARGERLKASKLKKRMPNYSLDHLVKERYPSFIDALNDLDDPLCLLSLFASFPAHKELKIQNDLVLNCQRLLKQFLIYIIKNHALRKVFLSIKGIYYQALVQGAVITWIQPYPLTPSLPLDVDYRVMTTFLEFYQVLMRFVNFKLLGKEINFGINSYLGGEYRNLIAEETQENIAKQSQYLYFFLIILRYEIDEKFNDDDQIQKIQFKKNEDKYSNLFKGLVFHLSTETPKQSLEFIILSFGGSVCWQGDEQNINESSITHVITERTNLTIVKSRDYIQPQWVYDSINKLTLLPVKDYSPDKVLPPHLSPFEEANQGQDKIDEEVQESDEDHPKVPSHRIEAPIHNQKAENNRKVKNQKIKEVEQKQLAETLLTRKNKRLYDMIKRKEVEKDEKVQQLNQKKHRINQQKNQQKRQ